MSSLPTIIEPQGGQMVTMSSETASTAVAAQARAMIEARYTMAIHRPRDIDQVREKLLKECRRPSFAAVARYRKPIGAGIEGPSIRFAEAALRCMGNVTIETVTLYDDREKRIVRVAVTDLEANVPYSLDVLVEKTVERSKIKNGMEVLRSRTNSYGEPVHIVVATDDDVMVKQAALVSKAIRTLGLRLVPGDLIDECMTLVKKTKADEDARDPDAARRQLFDAFAEQGVKVEQLKGYLGTDGSSLNPRELADLRGLYAAIKTGETTWRAIMEQVEDARTEAARAGEATGDKPKGTASERLRVAAGIPAKPAALVGELVEQLRDDPDAAERAAIAAHEAQQVARAGGAA